MKRVVRKGIRDILVDEVPDPVPGPHQVAIAPIYSLISSGTESASIHQAGVLREVVDNPSHLRKVWTVMKATGPVPTLREVLAKFSEYAGLGYAGAGLLVDKHPSVRDLEIGERVAYGGETTGHGERIVTGRNLAVRIPAEVKFEAACFTTLGSIALNAVRTAQVGVGDRVAVLGLGLVGQLTAQLARLQGGVVLGIDPRPERAELARKLGAEHTLTGEAGLRERVLALTGGRGADQVIVAAAAKSPEPCRRALEICRDRGRLVVVGAVELNFPWEQMYLKEIELRMARAYGPGSYDPLYEQQGMDYPLPYVRWTENRNMEEVLRLVGAGRLDVESLITHRFPLENAPEAYRTVMDPASGSLAVLLRYAAADPSAEEVTRSYRPAWKVATPHPPREGGALRFGLAGAGNIARWAHLPALRAAGASLRAVYSADGMRGKSYALRFRAAYCCSRYEELLADPEIDAVLIASRNSQHAPQVVAALEAGKHVFVEKPLALTVDECARIARAHQASGKLLTVGFNRRFAPFYRALKREVARRAGPAVLNCRVNSPGISGGYWMADPASGGAILGEACHFADLMYWLLESEPVQVMAFSLPVGPPEPVGRNNVAASFLFADGSIGNLTYCTVGSSTSAGERLEAFAPGLGVSTEDFKRLNVRTWRSRQSTRWFAEKGYQAQMDSFVRAVREGRAPEVTLVDGVRATVCCLALLESAATQRPQPIEFQSITG